MDVSTLETMEITSTAQMPQNWVDLPDHIWIRVMEPLTDHRLNCMHLTCKRLDEVASNYVPHKLIINRRNIKRGNEYPLRYFKEIYIKNSDVLRKSDEFQRMTSALEFIGIHVKRLKIAIPGNPRCTSEKLFKLLLLLPNLEYLNLGNLSLDEDEDDPAVGRIKLPKLITIKLEPRSNNSLDLVDFFLNNLEGFALNHLKVNYDEFDISSQKFLNFLGQQSSSLKTLRLNGLIIPNETLNFICENLPNLNILKLQSSYDGYEPLSTESTDNLCKLKKLKSFRIDFPYPDFNYLSGLGLAINENLQILEAGNFQSIPTSFITNLPSFIPNVNKIRIEEYPCELIDLLKLFENLEYLELELTCPNRKHKHKLVSMNDVVAKNLKYLAIRFQDFVMDPPTATKIARDYPNLESIEIDECCQLVDESVKILLKNLKNLRVFQMDNNDTYLSKRILKLIKIYGKKLTKFTVEKIDFGCETVREVLKDFRNFTFLGYSGLGFEVKVRF